MVSKRWDDYDVEAFLGRTLNLKEADQEKCIGHLDPRLLRLMGT